jgi:2-dehydro-3-deoxyphosphogluconate aldolase / (4S)-4-hydroxy-2-oxoglutarate aldolase
VRVIEEVVARSGEEMLVGAGTVLDAETARACILAGAEFVVSPALDFETIALCRTYGKVVLPGALTPTEILAAWRAGADFVKVFPCDSAGGAKHIRSIKAPLPQIPLVPTGGVSLETAAEFIEAGASALGVGSDLVDVKALRQGRPELITERARAYVELVREARSRSRGRLA